MADQGSGEGKGSVGMITPMLALEIAADMRKVAASVGACADLAGVRNTKSF